MSKSQGTSQLINKASIEVDSIASLIALDTDVFTKVNVNAFYSDTPWGFSRLFEWDSTQAKTGHDGWSIINPDHLSTIGSANWYDSDSDSTDDTGDGCWVALGNRDLNVLYFGAKDVVGFDSTVAFQAMADALGYVNVPYTAIPFEIDAFTTTKTTVITSSNGNGNILLRTPTTTNDAGFTLAHADSVIEKVHIDAGSTSRTCVALTSDNCEAYFTAENVTADATSTTSTSGLDVQGNNCRFDVYAENFSNTGQANESVPRIVTVQGTADNYSGRLQGLTVQSGLVIGSLTGRGKISELIIEGASDNGLYDLGGTVDIGEVVYNGSEEGIVVGGSCTIGSYKTVGSAGASISLNDGNLLQIGEYIIDTESGASATSLIRTRETKGFGDIYIGSITGRMRGSTLARIPTSNGNVDNLNIGSIDVIWEYDTSVSGVVSQWSNLEAVQRLFIGSLKVQIIDVNNVLTTENFVFRLNSSFSKKSNFYHPVIDIFDSDESTLSSASYQITNTNQEKLDYKIYKENKDDTYTATLTLSTSGTITLNTSENLLAYSKKGEQVFINGRLKVDSVSSPIGYILLNLPFDVSNQSELSGWGGATVWIYDGSDWGSHFLQLEEGSSSAQIRVDASTISIGDLFYFSFTYLTSE